MLETGVLCVIEVEYRVRIEECFSTNGRQIQVEAFVTTCNVVVGY
jgi:hypothetical protein